MDNNQISAKEILASYEEITIVSEIDKDILLIMIQNKEFLFFAPVATEPTSRADFCLVNDDGFDFPHIMLTEKVLPNIEGLPSGKYRWICLYEHESVVNSIISYEDKIIDAIDRLLELLLMNRIEREREFQKEFLFYWNSMSVGDTTANIYLHQEELCSKMDVYYGKNSIRLIEERTCLSDINTREKNERVWTHHVENDAYYIPITDTRGILPPHNGFEWQASEVRDIIYPKQVEHISEATFQFISATVPRTQNFILTFGMKVRGITVVFAARIKCKNSHGHSILEKVLEDIIAVEPLYTIRKDYLFLNELIGNDIGLRNKKVLVVGAGSLGSYVTFELVKNGVSQLAIYDGDKLEDANVLRWAYAGIGKNHNKATTLAMLLEILHPEIKIEAHDKKIGIEELVQEAAQTDYIIFTIGSSDEQLKMNRALKDANCQAVVIYAWLEAGGQDSHVLVVDYNKKGCYECLYTGRNGELVNNRATINKVPIDMAIVSNGCGGTRASYGTAVILRTVSALLTTIRKIQSKEIPSNMLLNITEDAVDYSDLELPMEGCRCCGNKNQESMCENNAAGRSSCGRP